MVTHRLVIHRLGIHRDRLEVHRFHNPQSPPLTALSHSLNKARTSTSQLPPSDNPCWLPSSAVSIATFTTFHYPPQPSTTQPQSGKSQRRVAAESRCSSPCSAEFWRPTRVAPARLADSRVALLQSACHAQSRPPDGTDARMCSSTPWNGERVRQPPERETYTSLRQFCAI